MAFRESTGEFMWQATFEKLSSGRANDWPFQGIASSPLVIDGVAYFVTNRGQVIAADLDGFHDKTNDGAVKDEKLTGINDPDFIWIFDMMEEVGSFPHNLSNSSPVAYQNLILRQHLERPGRESRQHPVAEGAVDHRARPDAPESWSGRTTRSRTASCTGSGPRRRSATSAA